MKKQLIRAAATTALGLSLTTGFAAADISGTGPSSHNSVKSEITNTAHVKNNNNLGVSNSNSQSATSGKAKTSHNTTGGDATSGDASNSNDFSASATVDNSGLWSANWNMGSGGATGDISNTGPNSNNTISSKVKNELKVTNNNNVSVTNTNSQSASTGSAEVSGNTTGGSATSGSASNSTSSTVDLSVTN